MPVTWEIRGSRLRVAPSGDHTLAELEQAASEILASPLFRPRMSVLVDVRHVTANHSTEQLREWTTRLAPYLPRFGVSSQCAIVTGPDLRRYTLNRSLAGIGGPSGFDIHVFHEMDEALEWLADITDPG